MTALYAICPQSVSGMLRHLFNHQTYHRGRVTALLCQHGHDPETAGFLTMLPDTEEVPPA